MAGCSITIAVGRHGARCFDPILSWTIGVLLLISGISHWANPYYFLGSVFAYDLVDSGVGQVIAMLLPILQLLLAVCLIARVWLDAAHLIVMVMLGCFVTVQSSAYFRGLHISCGCFGPGQEAPIGMASLLMVSSFLVLSIARNVIAWRSLGSG